MALYLFVQCLFSTLHKQGDNFMKKISESVTTLKNLIKHAIDDLEVTPAEYQKIMDCAHADGHIDKEEEALLAQFQGMISNRYGW
jgi:hemerythrin-like domain-containing protein